MSLSYLPSYLRSWIEAEKTCKPEECDLQETIDEQNGWVLVDYRNGASEGKHSGDLLQDYIVIEGQKDVRKVDDGWVDVGERVTRSSESNSSKKASRRSRKRARRTADRRSPCLGIPFKFTKLPTDLNTPRWQGTNAVPTVKIDFCQERLSGSIPSLKPNETQLGKAIVPFYGKESLGVFPSEVLRVFQDLAEKTSTAVIHCEFAQFNALNVCTTRDLDCVKNSRPIVQTCHGKTARDKTMFPNITGDNSVLSNMMARDQCIYPDIPAGDQCMCSGTTARDQCVFPHMVTSDVPVVNNNLVLPLDGNDKNDGEDIFEDCIDFTSKIFSLSTPESLYSKFSTTKKRIEELLKSLLLLHLFVGKKLQSWKEVTISNISHLSTHVAPVLTTAPHYTVSKSFAAIPEKQSRGQANAGHVIGKQLRRQNHMSMKNNVVNSNRQRGMKCGRFQNNVGHRESWH